MGISEHYLAVLRATGRVIIAMVVAYLFIIVLLVATAQQKVVDSLAADNVGFNYNVAVRYYFGKESLTAVRTQNSRALRESTGRLRKANDGVSDAQRSLAAQAADLRDDLARLAAAGCPSQQFAGDAAPDPAALLSAAEATRHCVAESRAANPALRDAATDVDAGADAIHKSLDDIAGLNRDIDDEKDQAKALEEERTAISNEVNAAAKASGIITILRVFEESPWPLAQPLVYVPPSLMAIILAFTSGLFGALLITLVIFVYPDSRFKFTKSASYAGRILLGGLIALGVFVLLFSGVAVLGGSEATGNSQNLMAYAAIGILSGMFSDQAAGWLSERSTMAMPTGQDALAQSGQSGAQPAADPPGPDSPDAPPA
jgi:cell division protein FtsB